MRHAPLLVALLAACAFGEPVLKNAGTTIGPVLSIECTADAGLFCSRASGSSTGSLKCATAGLVTTGCVIPGPQSFTGPKIFDGGVVVNGTLWVDGGVFVNSTLAVDGGAYIAGSLSVDAGVTAKANVTGSALKSTLGLFIFNTRADGGISYLEGDDPGGAIVAGASPSLYLAGLVSLPQTSHLGAYFPGVIATTVADRGSSVGSVHFTFSTLVGTRFVGPAQFTRLSMGIVGVGLGDGGVGADGGTQTFYADVFNATTVQHLCSTSLLLCTNTIGYYGNACALDGGALVAAGDDIELLVNASDCLVAPMMNVAAEYNGVP